MAPRFPSLTVSMDRGASEYGAPTENDGLTSGLGELGCGDADDAEAVEIAADRDERAMVTSADCNLPVAARHPR